MDGIDLEDPHFRGVQPGDLSTALPCHLFGASASVFGCFGEHLDFRFAGLAVDEFGGLSGEHNALLNLLLGSAVQCPNNGDVPRLDADSLGQTEARSTLLRPAGGILDSGYDFFDADRSENDIGATILAEQSANFRPVVRKFALCVQKRCRLGGEGTTPDDKVRDNILARRSLDGDKLRMLDPQPGTGA